MYNKNMYKRKHERLEQCRHDEIYKIKQEQYILRPQSGTNVRQCQKFRITISQCDCLWPAFTDQPTGMPIPHALFTRLVPQFGLFPLAKARSTFSSPSSLFYSHTHKYHYCLASLFTIIAEQMDDAHR